MKVIELWCFCRGGDRYGAQLFSRGYSFMFVERASKKNQKTPHKRPQTLSTENPNPKKPNLRPQNHNKNSKNKKKIININLGKNIADMA